MLQQFCENVRNYFIKAAYPGTYSIIDGTLSLPFLKNGQRFWIVGSDLNDGVYTYHDTGIMNDDDDAVAGLSDEDFKGTICAMAVPPAVVALSGEIKLWVEKYGSTVDSPYQSESFNGYSYSLKSGSGDGSQGGPNWQGAFADRMRVWRKV